MTSCNRDVSPVVKRKEKERHMELILEEGKIHRLQLNVPALCKIANVESPNCIWFKLLNNIADQLQVARPARIEPLVPRKKDVNNNGTLAQQENGLTHQTALAEEDDDEKKESKPAIYPYQYVLAPLEENLYARGRIINLQDVKGPNKRELQFAYVFFIDEGFGAWMSTKCLAKMERELYAHPWQAFPVSLFRLLRESGSNSWPHDFTYALIDVLTDYQFFKVVPVIDSRRRPNYFEYKRVELYGLESTDDDEGPDGNAESITHRLVLEYGEQMDMVADHDDSERKLGETSLLDGGCFDRTMFDAKQQPLYREADNILMSEDLAEMAKWRLHWPKRFGVSGNSEDNENTAGKIAKKSQFNRIEEEE